MTDGQRPGESERDYHRRLMREVNEAKRAKRDEKIERRMIGDAAYEMREKRGDALADQDLEDFAKDFGISLEEMGKLLRKHASPEENRAMDEVQKALGKKGWFGDRKARAAMKKYRKTLRGAAKKAKKRRGWFW